jgi:alkylhydroperoxidase family enzyme
MSITQPFLSPIESPKGFMMKLVYYFTQKRMGKVITPVKVMSARLPIAFGMYAAKGYQLDEKLTLPKELVLLIRQQVARINVCRFCIDAGRFKAILESVGQQKFDALDEFETSLLFSEAERSALAYATELTRDKKVDPANFSRMATHYSEREICEIVFLVSSEHLANIANIGLNIHSDMLCEIGKR